MASKNTGKKFEKLVGAYYESLRELMGSEVEISLDEIVEGPDGKRQCDIVLEHRYMGLKYRTLVECKDRARPIEIETVEAFITKLGSLNFNKGIMISRAGFQSGAKKTADRAGVELSSFAEVSKQNVDPRRNLPFLHLVMTFTDIVINFDVEPDILYPLEAMYPIFSKVDGIVDLVDSHLPPTTKFLVGITNTRTSINFPQAINTRTKPSKKNYFIQTHDMRNVTIYAAYNTKAYLGKLEDLDEYYVKRNFTDDETETFIPKQEIGKLASKLQLIQEEGEVPEYLYAGGFVTYRKRYDRKLYQLRAIVETKSSLEAFDAIFKTADRPKGQWLQIHSVRDIFS